MLINRMLSFYVQYAAICCIAVAGFLVMLRIERLNSLAGGYLPRHDIILDGANNTWRTTIWMTEWLWRRIMAGRMQDDSLLTRPLTADEQADMEKMIQRLNTNNFLYQWVLAWGPWVYIAAAGVMLWSGIVGVWLGRCRRLLLLCIPCVLAMTALVVAVYRGYFSSIWFYM